MNIDNMQALLNKAARAKEAIAWFDDMLKQDVIGPGHVHIQLNLHWNSVHGKADSASQYVKDHLQRSCRGLLEQARHQALRDYEFVKQQLSGETLDD